jgi:hypothetical protein
MLVVQLDEMEFARQVGDRSSCRETASIIEEGTGRTTAAAIPRLALDPAFPQRLLNGAGRHMARLAFVYPARGARAQSLSVAEKHDTRFRSSCRIAPFPLAMIIAVEHLLETARTEQLFEIGAAGLLNLRRRCLPLGLLRGSL